MTRRVVLPTLAVAALALAACSEPASAPTSEATRLSSEFDLQAHRGGAGLAPENSLTAFGSAIDLGVSTLELDAQVTKDGKVVVNHDQIISPRRCTDGPAPTGTDPMYPYTSRKIKDLTLAQVQTLRCGGGTETIPELRSVFQLAKSKGANAIRFNIEIKTDPTDPELTVPREQYIAAVVNEIDAAGLADRVSIQSFDWATLKGVPTAAPKVRLVALTSPDRTEAGLPGTSPWMAGTDIDSSGGDIVAAARSIPNLWAISPREDFPVDRAMVDSAHRAGLQVIPWTVDDADRMGELIDLGVDGIITDHPDVLRDVLTKRKLPVPTPLTR